MLKPQTLGQLLLMQSIVISLPDEKSIFSFVCHGLLDMPGVIGVRYAELQEQVDPPIVRFPLLLGERCRGELLITVEDPETFAPYADYVENFCYMLAVILEERSQRHQNELFQSQLETRIQERTRQLEEQIAERLVIEESLRESEGRFRSLVENLPVKVFIKDRESVYVDCNPSYAGDLGINPKEIRGKTDYDYYPKELAEKYRAVDRMVMEFSREEETEEPYYTNGHQKWVRSVKIPLIDETHNVTGILGVFWDITERRQAEQELRNSEADLKRAQAIAKLGSWTYNPSGLISWSDELYRIYGVNPESFTPTVESFINLIHPEDKTAMRAMVNACASGESPRELEFRVILPDGTVRFISGRGEIVHNDTDNQIHMAGTAQDITERKKAEEALAKSESAFRATFEQAAVGMARVAPDGRWLEVNQRLCEVVGYTRDELLAMTYQDVMHPDDLDSDLGYVRQVLVGEIETYTKEIRFFRKDKTIIWINFTVGAVRDSSGAPAYSISVVEDITKRKLAEEQLADKQLLLEELNISLEKRVEDSVSELREKDQILIQQGRQAAMGEMMGNIAHQWRQPLNTLGLIVQELLMTYSRNESYKENLEAGVKKAMCLIQHMSKTIDDFNNYFKPEKEKILFSANKSVSKALNLIEPSLINLNINIEVIEKAEISINGYANEYSQVLLNILLNCRDAFEQIKADRRRAIIITVSEENNKSVVTVADNAGGVPEGIIGKVFDPYFTTKGPDKGTGIGLYMAKAIIEKNMGGSLTVRNIVDGAEFRIEV